MAASDAPVSSSTSIMNGKSGVPSFAVPWIELGKLEEREKWQALAVDLVGNSVISELQELKRSVAEDIPRLPELKQNVGTKVDEAQTKISNLIAEYRKLLLVDTSTAIDRKLMMHALQYQACDGHEESLRDMYEDFTHRVTEEIAIEEIMPEKNA